MTQSELYIYEMHERRAQRKKRWRALLFLIMGYVLVLGLAWLILDSPVFALKEVATTGNAKTPTDQIYSAVLASTGRNSGVKYFLGTSNILFWPADFPEGNAVFLPAVGNVKIDKNYLQRKISVQITERKPYGIWCLGSSDEKTGGDDGTSCYWFDRQGVIFERSFAAEGNLIQTISDASGRRLGLSSRILPDNLTEPMLLILETIKNSEINVREIKLKDLNLQEVEVTSNGGPALYFSLRFSSDRLADAINALRQKVNFDKLEYVDFRVENRVYYK